MGVGGLPAIEKIAVARGKIVGFGGWVGLGGLKRQWMGFEQIGAG